ncbi:GlxA family transcriptional regulator [Streptomyces sp. NBC_00365]|uniref:GlxA family transcriptional regulator n=1 Tax=Streptomyces sp. NBC_00365 TaxID=2975726 RepID=UPI002256B07B|nr:GlxA family transcriptional regulator [Streptomyces sp. NBC_00365]MCX5096893.1 GlxA family transcriptional regulator [Streptomyces sp. NBC_00365]
MPGRKHTITVVAFEGVQLLDVTGPVEVFTAANQYGADYDVRIVSPTGLGVRTSSGVTIGVDGMQAGFPPGPNTVVVPGRKDWRSAVADTTLIDLVHRLAEGADRVVSVCAGAFVLAEAGLLNGRRVATHWEMAAQLAAAYADTRVEDNPIFIQDGHVITSAGVTAGIDLALHLVERDWGADVARRVARELVVFMARPGGQAQFSARLVTREPRHAAIRRVLDHVAADPAGEHTLDSLACAGGLSRRHLARLFRTEVGMTPGQYVESVRTEAARALLEGGSGSVEEVAQQAGFGSSESLRRVFQHTLGVSPSAYRARFRSTVPEPGELSGAHPVGRTFP